MTLPNLRWPRLLRGKDTRRVEELLQSGLQSGLLVVAWVLAFLLGKELQTGFTQWRTRQRSESE